ncbi:hypothetical protein V6C53_10515 [Desulfocurvibacter africanus]|uniref:hypothetical protein n=1 Tax=Desulfocurvibacter africanus TaxID=873 RepID=UPI002FD9E8EB
MAFSFFCQCLALSSPCAAYLETEKAIFPISPIANLLLKQIAFKTPAPALTAQVNCAYACAAASHADAWLVEHFQKQNALQKSS